MKSWKDVPVARRRQLYKLATAHSATSQALQMARDIKSNDLQVDNPLWEPLQDYIIITYGRPFTANEGYGPLPPKYSKFRKKELQTLHEQVLEQRHKFIAHSDAGIGHVAVVPEGLTMPTRKNPTESVGFVVSRRKFSPQKIDELIELFSTVSMQIMGDLVAELDNAYGPGTTMPTYMFNLLTNEEDKTR